MVPQSSPAFWECSPPLGVTHSKHKVNIIINLNISKSQGGKSERHLIGLQGASYNCFVNYEGYI
jgi:hypothetical protein